jgi:hypothetical protein
VSTMKVTATASSESRTTATKMVVMVWCFMG